jgi:lactoylglutathione lyase
MRIDHIACWTEDIDRLAAFYARYFSAEIKSPYHNPVKNFTSRFLVFPEGGRLEVMHNPEIQIPPTSPHIGFIHLAFSVGSQDAVDQLTEILRNDGFPPIDGPRWTGDGYYETALLDPDGNRIEITL